jgi:magnesium-transporting ATPase (P-type)
MDQFPSAFWCVSATKILPAPWNAKEGLSREEARHRLARCGSNLLQPQNRSNVLTLLLVQFKSPLILILLFATGLTFFLHDPINALIIRARYLSIATLLTVLATVVLPFTPLGGIFEFSPLPISFLVLIAIIVVLYIIAAEIVKAAFNKKVKNCEDTAKTAVRTFRRRTVGQPRAGDCHEK